MRALIVLAVLAPGMALAQSDTDLSQCKLKGYSPDMYEGALIQLNTKNQAGVIKGVIYDPESSFITFSSNDVKILFNAYNYTVAEFAAAFAKAYKIAMAKNPTAGYPSYVYSDPAKACTVEIADLLGNGEYSITLTKSKLKLDDTSKGKLNF